jgi:metallothionein
MKCECTQNCTCEVEQQKSVERNGKYYCDEACASGHPSGQGCGHQGCHC